MILARNRLLAAVAVCGAALLASAPASARTICGPDGICYNTSGDPIAPEQQPRYQYYNQPGYGYGYYRHHHHHHYWRHDAY